MDDNSDNAYGCIPTDIVIYCKRNFKENQIVMSKDNLMGLFETQEYISSESHEWNVPFDAKEKVVKMVQKYNERAIKMGYNDSILNFDASSLTLRGIFVLKAEKTSWLAKRLEDGRNADLSGDIMRILALCNKVCSTCQGM